MSGLSIFEEIVLPAEKLHLRDGASIQDPVLIRGSRLYPGHRSLISENRLLRQLPNSAVSVAEEEIDPETCRFCRPELLCDEASRERSLIMVEGREFLLARNPYYYLPGHSVLFARRAPHRLMDTKGEDWRRLLDAGVQAARGKRAFRLGFNAGTYLCCGGSQRHLHLQLISLKGLAPMESALARSVAEGASFSMLMNACRRRGLLVDIAPGNGAFLAACWAPRFNLELFAVFARPNTFQEMEPSEVACLSQWIHGAALRFVIPAGGGINGFGLEVPGLPFMVRIIPRLPGAVQAFLEIGAGLMAISYLPETVPMLWQR